MTATQTQLRRGTSAQCNAMTPAEAEVVVDTTNDIIRIGDGSTPGGIDVPNYVDIQTQSYEYVVAGGTADAITLTPQRALPSYVEGTSFEFRATANNTGAVTVAISGLSTVSIVKDVNGVLTALSADDIKTGIIYRITYNNVGSFQLTSAAGGVSSITFGTGLTGGTISDNGTVGIDTNNSGGVGSYRIASLVGTVTSLTNGSTVAGSQLACYETYYNPASGSEVLVASSTGLSGTWRNVSGNTMVSTSVKRTLALMIRTV